MIKGLSKALAGLLVAAGLAGCVSTPASSPKPKPAPVRPEPSAAQTPMTEKSKAAQAYYAQVQQALLAQGLMRTDGGGVDTPYNERMLADNFIRIALHDEYSRDAGGFVRAESTSILRRFEAPVRVEIHFGASVSEVARATDRARISSFLARLSKAANHPISLVNSGGNFIVHIVSEDEREALGPEIRRELPGLSARDIADVTGMARSTYCMVYALSPGNTGVYSKAVAVIRAEHPDLLRLSCLHEEITQGLGLANDSPRARPSIFNDDEEFALLTKMDEQLLRILYDPQLKPGMRIEEARPIVDAIANQLMGTSS